jgi:uncharacterized protein Yka (UPF0111/DUF47 family)
MRRISGRGLGHDEHAKEAYMASVKDVERVADDLEKLVGQLRSELRDGVDFQKLVEIADSISEHADQAAGTFSTVNDALMSRIGELGGAAKSASGSARGSKSKV